MLRYYHSSQLRHTNITAVRQIGADVAQPSFLQIKTTSNTYQLHVASAELCVSAWGMIIVLLGPRVQEGQGQYAAQVEGEEGTHGAAAELEYSFK